MRYRRLVDGDMTFGAGGANFLVNSPEAVGQAVQTRLRLWTGQWFLNTIEGTPYLTQVLGVRTKPVYDIALKARILGTQGVRALLDYQSTLNGRALQVSARVDTIYGAAPGVITAYVQIGPAPTPLPPQGRLDFRDPANSGLSEVI